MLNAEGITAETQAALRAQTPSLARRLHLDHCGSSLMPAPVLDAVRAHTDLEAEVGGYVAQERAAAAVDLFYERMADLLGGDRMEYAFTASAVDAWVRAFYSVPMHEGDNIVTAFNEYCANYVAYDQQARRRGIEVRTIGPDETGALDLAAMERAIDARTRLVSVSHVPSSSGQINDVRGVGRLARGAGVPYLLDACQSVGQLSVNVDEIGCDLLTGTGRKFLRGPRGTGFLYVRRTMLDRLDPVFLTNASATWTGAPNRFERRRDARLFEGWEKSISGLLGLSAAVGYYLDHGPRDLQATLRCNASHLRSGLAALPGIDMTCPDSASAAIITFNVRGYRAEQVKALMEAENIAVQVARAEHTRIDLEARGIDSAVRVSPHYVTTRDEIDTFIARMNALSRP